MFCFERRVGQPAPLGRSVRYTLMVELGLVRAQAAGYQVPFDLDELDAVAWRELEAGELTPGDIGLMLWVDARREGRRGASAGRSPGCGPSGNRGPRSAARDGAGVDRDRDWRTTSRLTGASTGARLLADALDQLLLRNRAASALVRHFGDAGWRRRFPNFATQIYSVLALAVVARHGLDDRALPAAIGDGGTPAGNAVARRRLALALRCRPRHRRRALRDLFGSSGRDGADGVARALGALRETRATSPQSREGLLWIQGGNELGVDMVDRANGLVLRSIRRTPGQRPALGWSEDGRIARRPADARSDCTPDRDQPNRPPVPLRLGPRGLVRT